jgi:tRNA(Ser,Leu) C12 N-acetylase TAN1
MILDIGEKDKVVGEIYKITNTTNGKVYIGQTRSHRLNHNKYRPFGYLGRFKDHIHEAFSSKQKQSKCLNSAIRKNGPDSFTCELIHTCDVRELNEQEEQFIIEYNSKYPNGYNLTNGGRGFTDVKGKFCWREELPMPPKCSKPQPKSDYTKQLISDRLKSALDNEEHREKMMKLTQKQHLTKKYDLFKDVVIVDDDIDSYIRVIKNNMNNTEYVRIVIDKKRTTFVGKHEPIDEIKERAKKFILDLKEWQRSQIESGNPLEPQTTTL